MISLLRSLYRRPCAHIVSQDVGGDAVGYAGSRFLHRIPREMGMARRGLDLSVAEQLSGQALTERQGAARIGVLEVVNSYPLDPGLLPHPPPVGRRGVFLRGGWELRQRCARKRWSLIEFACVPLTGKIKHINYQFNQWYKIIHNEPGDRPPNRTCPIRRR